MLSARKELVRYQDHAVSESVLEVLAEEKVLVTGLPWRKGQQKILPFARSSRSA
jgi:hypothetical protein